MANAAVVQLLDRWAGSRDSEADASLIGRFRAERDEDAFAILVRRHGSLVYGTCQRILGNRTEADDAFQATFFVLARRAHTIKLDRSIGPWLHGVARRVAMKARTQTVRRRLREMSAAKSERIVVADCDRDFWAVIDEEIARLPRGLGQTIQLCDLGGQSHAQAAASLGLAKGTVTKRLARAHEELAGRLKRRGITLGIGALSTLFATRGTASVPASLLADTTRQAVVFSLGKITESLAAQTLAEGVMRSIKLGVAKVWLVVGLLGIMLAGGGLMLAGDPRTPDDKRDAPKAKTETKSEPAIVGTMWKETFTCEYESSLPVSAVFSPDGKRLLTGDLSGNVMAVRYPSDPPTYEWMTNVGGEHPAVAYSLNHKYIYATTQHGVRILDASSGKELARIDEQNSNPIAIGEFPKLIDAKFPQLQIVFGNARGYFVKTWRDVGNPAETMGTIQTKTSATPTDLAAVPLAVDPKGRSAIMTGPIDAKTKKNVLWAYVCGDYEEGSPGNRVMEGHTATVVSAAWSKEGSTAVTGDADGRLIVWDAKTMKETRRIELRGRIMALAMSPDGTLVAACVRGKQGAEFLVLEAAKPASAPKLIHNQQGDFSGEPYASLAFSADGKRLAGSAIDKTWPKSLRVRRLSGQVHVWELSPEPKGQPAPKQIYSSKLSKDYSPNFVILDNFTILTAATKEGAIDFRNIKNGEIQARIVMGKFEIGRMKLSSDRKWLAFEQHTPIDPKVTEKPTLKFDVGLWNMRNHDLKTIPSCSAMLDVASDGKVAAVVRDGVVELWDVATEKLVKKAPFKHTRIDAAQFSPDGKMLAVSDRNELVLWQWEDDKHERIDLGRCVGSLAFSPDGKFLIEGPTPRENIQVREIATKKVVRELANGAKHSMNVPRLALTQGGRVLIGCDNITLVKEIPVPHRINFWDVETGAVAQQIALESGLPLSIDVSPNGRYLAAMIEDGEAGLKLNVWRLDGQSAAEEPAGPTPPAATRPK
ncbi:MAG TPA: sigma-70 family RNA polymerase sigma factor [Gemmataceae bacterium]|jgi:RNA polymerase sigma factor (sigma-70 family)|nr:sigma-70 family RNA polymerase sigma factor [Gemmataceae bacterium]